MTGPQTIASVTDADRALAADLGLVLVRQTTARQRTNDASRHPPETWMVKVAATGRPVGRLHFTEARSLYATKFAASKSCIEETVAAALRWVAPAVRHARLDEPPSATECGAAPGAADHSSAEARSAILNGEASEVCVDCRATLEARGVSDDLPDRAGSATPRQRAFLRRLLEQARRHGLAFALEGAAHATSSRAASEMIDALKALRASEWKEKP